ncbi:MAG: hypothetical protein ACJ752_04530 [Gaiellaceae bacterium]
MSKPVPMAMAIVPPPLTVRADERRLVLLERNDGESAESLTAGAGDLLTGLIITA